MFKIVHKDLFNIWRRISKSVLFNIDTYSESIQFQVHGKKSHFVRKTYSGPNNCQPECQYCKSCQALSVLIKSISQYHSWSLISDSFKISGSESLTSQLI